MKDSIMKFETNKEIELKYSNEFNIIDSAWFGISFLKDRTIEINQQTKNKINPDGNINMMIFPNDPLINGIPVKLYY